MVKAKPCDEQKSTVIPRTAAKSGPNTDLQDDQRAGRRRRIKQAQLKSLHNIKSSLFDTIFRVAYL